jgi:chemotaxis protein histidine kinase CheA
MAIRSEPISVEHIQRRLSLLWEEHADAVCKRVLVLEAAAEAMATDELDAELESRSRCEAHTLNGELSTFGFKVGSQICAEIEALLSDSARRGTSEASLLFGLVLMLRQELNWIKSSFRQSGTVH